MCTITVSDVRAEIKTNYSDLMLQGFISKVDTVDACLASSNIADELCKTLKLLAVCHMVETTQKSIMSETSFTGDSVTYKDTGSASGLGSTSYGATLLQLDATGCLTGLFNPSRFVRAI